LFTKNGFDILRCSACGLGRTLANDFQPGQYYTEDYFSGAHADGYADYRGSEHILRREFAHTVNFIRRCRSGGRLLDIGCAYGFFLSEAQPFYDVSGIEIAADAAEFCRRRGLNAITGVADERTLAPLGTMDVIVMLDVIEHLPDPQQTLALCYRHLSPGGIIVITTGDFSSLCARLMGRHWRLMTPPQHLWFFTAAGVERLARSLGLHLESFDHPWKLVPLSLIAFQLQRIAGLKPGQSRSGSRIGMPVNMFDAMRCVLRKPQS
jgi:2-polyprenyl-3-methyl-5-hydroxy-6-metoxy-1,4-benzoquinol methylase